MKLPAILGADRSKMFVWLALNGVGQASLAVATSLLLSRALTGKDGFSFFSLSFLVILMLLSLLILLLRSYERVQAERIGQSYVTSCRSRFFRVIASAPVYGSISDRQGLLMTRLITDLTSMKNWVGFGLAKIAVSFFSVSGAFIALYMLEPGMALACLYAIGIIVVMGGLASFMLRIKIRQARLLRGTLAAQMGELALAKGLSLHFNRIERDKNRLRRQSQSMSDALAQRGFWSDFIRSLPDMVMPLTFTIVLLISLQQNKIADLNSALLASSLFMIGLIVLPIRDMMIAIEHYLSYAEGRFRLTNALARYSSIYQENDENDETLENAKGAASLKIENLIVPGCQQSFSGFIQPGQAVMIMSDHSAIKDHVFHKLSGLGHIDHTPQQMENSDEAHDMVMLDGRDMMDISSSDWHGRVKILSPDLPLVKGSLKRNITFGVSKLSEKKFNKIAKICGLDADDSELSAKGFQTLIHENGKNISTSLRARISLGRALATEPGLLLINDPSFLLDQKAQAALLEVVRMRKITILLAGIKDFHQNLWDQTWCLHQDGHLIKE